MGLSVSSVFEILFLVEFVMMFRLYEYSFDVLLKWLI